MLYLCSSSIFTITEFTSNYDNSLKDKITMSLRWESMVPYLFRECLLTHTYITVDFVSGLRRLKHTYINVSVLRNRQNTRS
jgi:predicted membrane protein